jgi:hypothetical protein
MLSAAQVGIRGVESTIHGGKRDAQRAAATLVSAVEMGMLRQSGERLRNCSRSGWPTSKPSAVRRSQWPDTARLVPAPSDLSRTVWSALQRACSQAVRTRLFTLFTLFMLSRNSRRGLPKIDNLDDDLAHQSN